MSLPSNDASYYSYKWVGAMPTDPIESHVYNKELTVVSDDQLTRKHIANFKLTPIVLFDLKCQLWRFTPLIAPGQLGSPIKVFTCETDGTRVVPGQPSATGEAMNNGNPTAGDQIEILWGVQEKTGRRGEDLPNWFHLTRPFIEKIDVSMQFKDSDKARLVTHAPLTDTQRGSTSTSSSVSYSFNLGMFGTDATAGGAISADYSHSNSMELTDYMVRSDSNEFATKHSIRMSMLSGGIEYDDYTSAPVNAKLPQRATSDMPLACQGIWELPDISDELEFVVTIEVTIATLFSRDLTPMMNQQFYITDPGTPVFLPADIFGPNTPARDLNGKQKIKYPPLREADKHYTQSTFKWERTIKVPLAKADTKIPTRER
ncbi:hypothetical protein [Aliiglaciecola sp. NS0011-25]|uniref:hypothetical protein n=1 Tax=Aliiglaciecola sp. NS0011-25 TaxID=3127654 RepID=UPI0031050F98